MNTAINHFPRTPDAGVVAVLPSKLSVSETKKLSQYEQIIERGLQTFLEVGSTFARVRDEQLWREGYSSFKDYLSRRWQITDRHGRHMIEAAKVVENLKASDPAMPLPLTESQARPLTSLPPSQVPEVWKAALASAPAGKVTAKHVQAAVEQKRDSAKWPQPNSSGVYVQEGLRRTFSAKGLKANVAVLQVGESLWVWLSNYQFSCGNCAGVGYGFSKEQSVGSKDVAWEMAFHELIHSMQAVISEPPAGTFNSQRAIAKKCITWAVQLREKEVPLATTEKQKRVERPKPAKVSAKPKMFVAQISASVVFRKAGRLRPGRDTGRV